MNKDDFEKLAGYTDSEALAELEAELDTLTDLPELDDLLDCPELDEALALQFDSPVFQELDDLLNSTDFDDLLPTDEEIAELLDFDLQDDSFLMELDDIDTEQEEYT